MKWLLSLAILACGLLAGCETVDTNPDPHRFEDITGPDNTEGWW